MKKFHLLLLCIISTSISAVNHSCDYMSGNWYGSGHLDKNIDCKYDVDASVSWSNPNYMRIQMKSLSSNPLCKQYYSEYVRLTCNNDHVFATNSSMKLAGYNYNYQTDVTLEGTLLSRLHYHPFTLKLHNK